ncbi:SDR family NAD(P)-dependent oxidoreductase [Sphingomonas sanxanigenens]|uniref:SDR family oxidoreductase n=1 Tax=Sphingomonas sanxanigenens DSM 19645 = NX02 TaxID=1123269 RepID=W0ADJ6_9SPHN|nr:SDR family oxidoreductase [Sphingomonas sanxanigenens]AHE53755.1 hypothetical protein NX02_10190 [Sphingomonas sanxanigenens DSM 19645 = NX02]
MLFVPSAAKDLVDLRAVVIGGTRGIGRAVRTGLLARGATVVTGGRGDGVLEGVEPQPPLPGCDVRSGAAVADFLAAASEAMGGIDVVINCASSLTLGETEADWDAAFQTDLMGSVRVVTHAVSHLRRSRMAAIVLTSSVVTRRPDPQRFAYGAMKAAIEHFTASAALRHAADGIRINCAVPGSTHTAIWDAVRDRVPQIYETTVRDIPRGRLADADEIASAILFLASPQAGWITGQCLAIDGGQGLGTRSLTEHSHAHAIRQRFAET